MEPDFNIRSEMKYQRITEDYLESTSPITESNNTPFKGQNRVGVFNFGHFQGKNAQEENTDI